MKYLLCFLFLTFAIFSSGLESKDTIRNKLDSHIKKTISKKKEAKKKEEEKEEKEEKDEQKKKEKSLEDEKLKSDSLSVENEQELWLFKCYEDDYPLRDLVNFKTQYNFQYWKPTFIKGAKTTTTTLSYTTFELFLYRKLYRLRYETSTLGSAEQRQNELLQARKKDKWTRYLADIPIPFCPAIYFSYVKEIFRGSVKTEEDKTYIPSHYDPDLDDVSLYVFQAGELIEFETSFQDFLLGIRTIDESPDFAFGLFFTRYEKPYSLTMDEEQVTEYVFDSTFSGVGPYLHLSNDNPVFKVLADFKIGLGSINLKGIDMNVEDSIEDGLILYYELNLGADLKKTTSNGRFSFFGGFDTKVRMFEILYTYEVENSDSLDNTETDTIFLNRDFIFNCTLGLSINF